ncbi:MAG: hypothetical protein B0A82_26025 [Alkalinema sp. CACIAM 70d]|nr:MAG: hypothetical protein B0A82_26025 [Alkalinema sp. CACIAM 70d]
MVRDSFFNSALLLLLALGATWWLGTLLTSPSMLQPDPLPQELALPHPALLGSPKAYWLKGEGDRLQLVAQTVPVSSKASTTQQLTESLQQVLRSPPNPGVSTTIPPGTRLLALTIEPNGIHVNLSREFAQGGGSSSLIHRVAQILYTVTSVDPRAKVYLAVEGQVLDEAHPLGGEGLVLDAPLTRQQFVHEFSLQ